MVNAMANSNLVEQHHALAAPLPTPEKLGEQLLAAGCITPDQLQIALHEQARHGGLLGQLLCQLGYLDEAQLCQALARRSGLAALTAEELTPDLQLLRYISYASAAQWQILPLHMQDGVMVMACADPFDIVAQNKIQAALGARIRVSYRLAPPRQLRHAIAAAYGVDEKPAVQPTPTAAEVAAWFERLVQQAVECDASDLHFVPEATVLHVRLRVDGVMHTLKTMHHDFWPALLQRLKILAGVNIAETRQPQDGRFSQSAAGVTIDCRAGFMPTIHGEAVALRLLDPRRARRSFAAMGFTSPQIAQFQDWLRRPDGLVLVTGPTGSGKSTTLNAMLQALDRSTRNIMTLEDPVEYHFDGIRQTQVREQYGLGFAEGVRTLLRHDPDVIMIGEIRDADTAQQAMRAAMTGHLVLSSLHTTNAAGVIPRLLDLGVSRDLLAQHLRGVVAQRLVCTLCQQCAPRLRLVSSAEAVASKQDCDHCFGTGRRGRMVVAEVLDMPRHAAALFSRSDEKPSYATMWDQGMALVQAGRIAASDLAAMVPQPDGEAG